MNKNNSRFDIKGCLAGRYQSPGSGTKQSQETVLKDKNFQGSLIMLGEDRTWFLKQIARDTEFLRRNRIVDYSLLVGLQTEFPENKEADLISEKIPSPREDPSQQQQQQNKLEFSERKAIWSSLARLVDDQGREGETERDLIKDDKTRLESRLSNISAIVELLGDGSPVLGNSPARKPVTILKKFLTPKKSGGRSAVLTSTSSTSSTPTNSFQIHPPPSPLSQNSLDTRSPEPRDSTRKNSLAGTFKTIFSSIFQPNARLKIHPETELQQIINSPRQHDNTVICAQTVHDLFEIREVEEREFSLDNWQRYLGERDSNRRILNNQVNALHIVDGIDVR